MCWFRVKCTPTVFQLASSKISITLFPFESAPLNVLRGESSPGGLAEVDVCLMRVVGEERGELVSDLAALGVAVFPLMRVDLQCRIGFAVSQSMLNVDQRHIHGDQHAG